MIDGVAPSAAAAAGAAAAAHLTRQLAQEGKQRNPDAVWSQHQTGDGRKYYFNEELDVSTWEKPEALMTKEEKAASETKWKAYKIWDGRVFYFDKESKVSVWCVPPEVTEALGEIPVSDDPIKPTKAELRKRFWDLMKFKGVDDNWTWTRLEKEMVGQAAARDLDETTRKQCFAELLSFTQKQKVIEERRRERNAASAFARLIEDRFANPEDLASTYEDAKRLLQGEAAWNLVKAEWQREQVFQEVMEKLEEKHKKARADERPNRILRLQRLFASDPELRRADLEWEEARKILADRDELQESPPLEALRVWLAMKELRTVNA